MFYPEVLYIIVMMSHILSKIEDIFITNALGVYFTCSCENSPGCTCDFWTISWRRKSTLKKHTETAPGVVPCATANSAIVLVTKHFYLIMKQWRKEPDHGRWPQKGKLNGGKLWKPFP